MHARVSRRRDPRSLQRRHRQLDRTLRLQASRTGEHGRYSVEHSVYVHKDHRGKGIGLALMQQLIGKAKEQQYHVMVGGIDVTNTSSIALHEKLGFVHAGTIKHAAFTFGRWLDLGFYQLLLETPAHPIDG